ncbi:MAG TPA: DinB family protein [Myxococcota bacterium]|nr:DinB family protein [Myxococcota bacterium]
MAHDHAAGRADAQTDRTRRRLALPEATALLARTPGILNAWLRGLPEGWLVAHEGGETWSPTDVVGHLIHGERTDWIPRVHRILEHGDSLAFDPYDRFAQFREFVGMSLPDLLDEFARAREANLRDFASLMLDDAALDRPGLHPSLGAVTLRQLLAAWVAHDLDHVTQIARVMAMQYADEVGPWRAYLRVISGNPG